MSENRSPRPRKEGPLFDLMMRCCPANEEGNKSVSALAVALGLRPSAVYKWLEKNSVPYWRVAALIKLSGDTVTRDELLKFVI